MTVHQAVRYELDPTARQRRIPAKAAGTARYAFNWGLVVCKRRLDAGVPVPHAVELHRLWNAEKPWRSWGVSKCCGQEALRGLDPAFANFWRGRQEGRRVGFPRFRRKHGRRDSFRLTGRTGVHPWSLSLPRLGGVRTKETTQRFHGRILSATVCRQADRWYVSLAVEVARDDPQPVEGPVAGIDLGLQSFAVLSDGSLLESPKPLAKAQRGSRHRPKSAAGLARLHRRIRCRRTDFLHKATTGLAKTRSVLVARRPVRARHDPQPASFAVHRGFRLVGVPADAGGQDFRGTGLR